MAHVLERSRARLGWILVGGLVWPDVARASTGSAGDGDAHPTGTAAAIVATGAATTDASDDAATGGATAGATVSSEGLELSAVVGEATAVEQELREIRRRLGDDDGLEETVASTDRWRDELEPIRETISSLDPGDASRAGLDDLERGLGAVEAGVQAEVDGLERRLDELAVVKKTLADAERTWTARTHDLRHQIEVPEVALARAQEVLGLVVALDSELTVRTGHLVRAQEAAAEVLGDAREAIVHLGEAQVQSRRRRWSRSARPLWELAAWSRQREAIAVHPLALKGLWPQFVDRYGDRMVGYLLGVALLVAVVVALGRWVVGRTTAVDASEIAALKRPLASAFVVALLSIRLVFPQAPVAVFHVAAILAVAPLARLSGLLLVVPAHRQAVYSLLGVFAVWEALALVSLPAGVLRIANLATTLALLLACLKVLREPRDPQTGGTWARWVLWPGVRSCVPLLSTSLVAGAVGYVELAALLTPGVLDAAYIALLLAVAESVLVGAISAVTTTPVARLSFALRYHGMVVLSRVRGVIRIVLAFAYVRFVLRTFDVFDVIATAVEGILRSELSLGGWSLSVVDVGAFALILALAVAVARVVVFIAEVDVLPRLSLPVGAPSTASRLLRYAILAAGFVFAIGAAGVDMKNVALFASALSVGIGFGLQNVVNNFVSGLILIFERPIREGDTVEVGGLKGRVERIGIRASIVYTFQGAEVIVPNADLISTQVINWTLSDPRRRVEIPVGVAYGTDADAVVDILLGVAREAELVLDEPAPVALFEGFGDSSLDFELRFWVDTREDWLQVASKAKMRIKTELETAGIEIPFPQRDLHVRSMPAGSPVASPVRVRDDGAEAPGAP